jgi:hypothetical protein
MDKTPQENEEVGIGRRHEAHRLYGKQFVYYTISRAFIDIPSILVSCSFVAKRKQKPKGRTILTPSPCLAYAFTIDSFSKCVIALLNALIIPPYMMLRSL